MNFTMKADGGAKYDVETLTHRQAVRLGVDFGTVVMRRPNAATAGEWYGKLQIRGRKATRNGVRVYVRRIGCEDREPVKGYVTNVAN